MAEIVKNNTKKTVIEYLNGKEIAFVFNYNRDTYFYKPGTSFKVSMEKIDNSYLIGIFFDNGKYFYYHNKNNRVIIDNIVYEELEYTVVRDILFLVNGLSSLVPKSTIGEITQMIKSGLKENKHEI